MARLNFRPIGASREGYPAWLRALTTSSGVYAIRERGVLVYVGSSQRTLRATIARHFSTWQRRGRKAGFWAGLFGRRDHDPGLTYDRGACTVAVVVTTPGQARDAELAAIRRLKPRDNRAGAATSDTSDVPF